MAKLLYFSANKAYIVLYIQFISINGDYHRPTQNDFLQISLAFCNHYFHYLSKTLIVHKLNVNPLNAYSKRKANQIKTS